jgi:hypothetical protein
MKLLDWFFNLFDNRTDFEKIEDIKTVQGIQELTRTHHVRVGPRGGISITKKTEEEMANVS